MTWEGELRTPGRTAPGRPGQGAGRVQERDAAAVPYQAVGFPSLGRPKPTFGQPGEMLFPGLAPSGGRSPCRCRPVWGQV